jgi:hypothetical protein
MFYKYDENKKSLGIIHIKRSGFKFLFDGNLDSDLKKDFPSFKGEITMDNRMPMYGKGYYVHIDDKGKESISPQFGFYEVNLNSNKDRFYVHRVYYSSKDDHKSAFVWEKINLSACSETLNNNIE